MAKIKVASDRPLFDGMVVTVKAPCDCSAVDGLIVGDTTFSFRDSHGNDLTGIGNLFSRDAYVRFTLDTKNGYAYIQNADTNGYVESEFVKKVDKYKNAAADYDAFEGDPGYILNRTHYDGKEKVFCSGYLRPGEAIQASIPITEGAYLLTLIDESDPSGSVVVASKKQASFAEDGDDLWMTINDEDWIVSYNPNTNQVKVIQCPSSITDVYLRIFKETPLKTLDVKYLPMDEIANAVIAAMGGSASGSVYPCTDGTYFWRELDEVDPVTGSNRVYLHPPKEPYYNKGVKNTANIFRTDEVAVMPDGTVKSPVYCATVVVPLSHFDPDTDGDDFGLYPCDWVSTHAVAYDETGYFNQLPWVDDSGIYIGSVTMYDAGLQICYQENMADYTVVMTIKYVK